MDWVDRVEDLLYDGESVEADVPLGEGGLVVTSHRVLAFTPDREGANYRAVDRPNVDGVAVETSGEWQFLEQGVKALVVGLALVVAGQTISLDSLVSDISLTDTGATGSVGLGGMMGLLQSMLTLLAQLDDLLRLFGGLALAFSVVVLGVYLWSRERLLVLSVAGDEDVELTAPDDEGVVEEIELALLPGDAPPGAADSTPTDSSPLDDRLA